jgi:uncharacterized DUF497 family protein
VLNWRGRFDWDETNLAHAARHDVTPAVVESVALGAPKLFPNVGAGRSWSNLMIGPDEDGKFWSVVLLEIAPEVWRPITGWPSTNSEIRRYEGES